MGCVLKCIMIIVPFIMIRRFSGGFHTKKPFTCLLGSNLLLFLCIWISLHISFSYLIATFSFLSGLSLMYFSPIENENKKLDELERRHCKNVTVLLTLFFLVVESMLLFCTLDCYSLCIALGIMLSAGMQLPCIQFKRKKSKVSPKRYGNCRFMQKALNL